MVCVARYSLLRNPDQLPPAHIAVADVKRARQGGTPFRSLEFKTFTGAEIEVCGLWDALGRVRMAAL